MLSKFDFVKNEALSNKVLFSHLYFHIESSPLETVCIKESISIWLISSRKHRYASLMHQKHRYKNINIYAFCFKVHIEKKKKRGSM